LKVFIYLEKKTREENAEMNNKTEKMKKNSCV